MALRHPPKISSSSNRAPRPLSPHLQIYKPQMTSVLSILHRMTGLALAVGYVGLIFWLWALVLGGQVFEITCVFLSSWVGQFLLMGWTFSLFYHLANGIRHLGWDAGYGIDLRDVYFTGWAVIAITTALTILFWVY